VFAEQLMREGEYFRAMTEYRRFLFVYPDDPRRAMAHFRIGVALYRGQSYDAALTIFREVAEQYPDTSYGKQAWLWQGESLMRQAQYSAAEQIYADIAHRFPFEEVGQFANYQRAWTMVYRRRWQEAAAQFQQVVPESTLYRTAQLLAEEVSDGEQLSRKSPVVAGLLSGLLPGSGQLYNGRPGDALLALLLNGVFVVGIIEAVQQDAPAIAGVLGFFEAGWYVGNIYSAVNGAHKHNRYATETFLRNLENRFQLSPPEAHRPQTFGLRLLSFGF
jgi:tetratricopeptide (TPR) repeat protein